jgi:hypothetical protein
MPQRDCPGVRQERDAVVQLLGLINSVNFIKIQWIRYPMNFKIGKGSSVADCVVNSVAAEMDGRSVVVWKRRLYDAHSFRGSCRGQPPMQRPVPSPPVVSLYTRLVLARSRRVTHHHPSHARWGRCSGGARCLCSRSLFPAQVPRQSCPIAGHVTAVDEQSGRRYTEPSRVERLF